MRMLELFAGTAHMSQAFRDEGWDTFTVDYDRRFDVDCHADIGSLDAGTILERFGRPDVVWASPDCTTFSIAAISHHRRRDPDTGYLLPVSPYATRCDAIDRHVMQLILTLAPRLWFVENPRGGMRKTQWMDGLPRYTVTYCQYGDTRMKPTDIWTNHPDPCFRPMCHNGDPCHERAPRGAKTGTQGLKGHVLRSQIPDRLCAHVASISTGFLAAKAMTPEFALAGPGGDR
jgi:hypothetical protein